MYIIFQSDTVSLMLKLQNQNNYNILFYCSSYGTVLLSGVSRLSYGRRFNKNADSRLAATDNSCLAISGIFRTWHLLTFKNRIYV